MGREELEAFVWQGEGGEPLRFADLTEAEQRVALIAAGALLNGADRRCKARPAEQIELPAAS